VKATIRMEGSPYELGVYFLVPLTFDRSPCTIIPGIPLILEVYLEGIFQVLKVYPGNRGRTQW